MATRDELIDMAVAQAERLHYDEHLHPEIAARYAAADAVLRSRFGEGAPPITSGFRSPAKQRELLRRFEAGDPGIVVRPARTSWHMEGRAIDVSRGHPMFDTFRAVWEDSGGRWGGRFSNPDDVHFDVPGPNPPRPAY